MAERKLNLNAPLLSVRRISSKLESPNETGNKKMIIKTSHLSRLHSLPVYKPDQSFDHLTELAAVPFVWERIPGRPKDGNKAESLKEGSKGKPYMSAEEDEDDVYSDALDKLSPPSASFSMSCSVSGISGFEDREFKRSQQCSADAQAREFMMCRFLPAAKAMTLDQPQYSLKKQSVVVPVQEQPRMSPKVISTESRPSSVNQREPIAKPLYHEGVEGEESVDDEAKDDDYDYDYDGDVSSSVVRKGWGGFLPRLCIKNSLCILNPVPGFKGKLSLKSHDLGKPGKAIRQKSPRKAVEKVEMDSAYKQKSGSRVQSLRLGPSNQLTTDFSGQLTPSLSSKRSGCISPYRNPAFRSPFRERQYLGTPKEVENFRVYELKKLRKGISRSQELYPRRTREILHSSGPIAEKTLYVDTVNFAESKTRMSSNSGTSSGIRRTEEHETLRNSSRIQDVELLSEEVNPRGGKLQDLKLDKERKRLERVKLASDEPYNDSETVAGPALSPIPPPLPKTPSESWLWRTLPSVTPRSSFSNSRFNPKSQESPKEIASQSTKWETIVKTSYSHHDHVRYSEELVTYTPRQF